MLAIADPELDHGPRADRSATMRMCAVSREVRPIDELIRFVVAPSGEVVADLKRKLPGRGLWVSASRKMVAEAVRRHQFQQGIQTRCPCGGDACRGHRGAAGTVSPSMRWPWPPRQARSFPVLPRLRRPRAPRSGRGQGADPCNRRRRRTESANWTPSPGKMAE